MLSAYLKGHFSSPELISSFSELYRLVRESPVNVTAIKDEESFAYKHILDSVYYFMNYPKKIATLADIGSGGGFPGLVLALVFPGWHISLVESIGKKCRFLESAKAALNLSNVEVINSRVEDITGRRFDMISARGVGTVLEVLKYTSAISDRKSGWLMYKGEKLDEELKEAEIYIKGRGIKSETIRVEEPFTRSYLYLHY